MAARIPTRSQSPTEFTTQTDSRKRRRSSSSLSCDVESPSFTDNNPPKKPKAMESYDKNFNPTSSIISSISPSTSYDKTGDSYLYSKSEFYHNELDQILEEQSLFILEAQEILKKTNHRHNLDSRTKQPLPLKTRRTPEYTVVLDLDETLVHASLTPLPETDLTFEVAMPDTTEYTVYVKRRPGLMDFLRHCSEKYELVLFTASKKIYADKLVSLLDPDKKYIRHRMYREHCRHIMLNYVKDLSVLGRDLRKTLIVDNSPQAFSYQLDNGIPIRSWFGDNTDTELYKLQNILEEVCSDKIDDIRPYLAQKFTIMSKILKFSHK